MIAVRKASERGHANHRWLDTYHTFSFASYHDPQHMGFGGLRVINEDRVAPGQGFGTHSHDNMEIVTYVLNGALEHKDSMGNGEVLTPGEFQRMSAGTGITHSEFNPSESEVSHFYQIWLIPAERDIPSSYEQKRFDDAELAGRLRLVASPDAADGSLTIHTDARVYLARLEGGQSIQHSLADGRRSWLQVLRGSVRVNGAKLETSDGAAIEQEQQIDVAADDEAEVMLFDMG